ncbi:Uncharacterized protein dnm_014870 [Desulfonema magnum]|uniref:Uncharacterized protein n=1 Tax=Desulfonema magnum TaxID=45655 RepID=A0A975BHI6_9BACT|nr:Uncharacterized protein dnm_014870 [Desulfonema magnum]
MFLTAFEQNLLTVQTSLYRKKKPTHFLSAHNINFFYGNSSPSYHKISSFFPIFALILKPFYGLVTLNKKSTGYDTALP